MSTTSRKARNGINWRIIVFGAVVASLPLWVVYTYVSDVMQQGVGGKNGEYTQVELKWMSSFDFNQTAGTIDDVPKRWRDLDGQKVLLRGEIWAPNSAGPEMTQFDLCYSIAKCCFSGPPQVQHFVRSQAVKGPVPNYNGLVEVRGTLHVNVIPGPDKIASVYQLDVDSVSLPDESFPMWIVWVGGGVIGAVGLIALVRKLNAMKAPQAVAAQLKPLTEPSGESNISRIPTQT
jgi:hypothetical protein